MPPLFLLLLSLLLLLTSQDQSLGWYSSPPSPTLTTQDAQCLVYHGVKKVFAHGSNTRMFELNKTLQFLIANFPVIPDTHIFIYATQRSPVAVLTNFSTYVNSTFYDTVWLEPDDKLTCQLFEIYIDLCEKMKIKCGFAIKDSDWRRTMGDDRMGCKQAAKLPLMYMSGPLIWTSMGGWSRYTYAPTDVAAIQYCLPSEHYLKKVETYEDR